MGAKYERDFENGGNNTTTHAAARKRAWNKYREEKVPRRISVDQSSVQIQATSEEVSKISHKILLTQFRSTDDLLPTLITSKPKTI